MKLGRLNMDRTIMEQGCTQMLSFYCVDSLHQDKEDAYEAAGALSSYVVSKNWILSGTGDVVRVGLDVVKWVDSFSLFYFPFITIIVYTIQHHFAAFTISQIIREPFLLTATATLLYISETSIEATLRIEESSVSYLPLASGWLLSARPLLHANS